MRRYLRMSLGDAARAKPVSRIVLDSGASEIDGFRVFTRGDAVHILGSNPRSLLFGVYAFLKRFCGCRWVHPDEETIPRHKELSVSLPTPWEESSPLKHRNLFPEGGHLPLPLIRKLIAWAPKNCIGDITFSISAWPKWRKALAPAIEKRGLSLNLSGHCLSTFMPRSTFRKHPEWFALIDGKRSAKGQHCFSSPSFRRRLKEKMLAYVASEPLLKRVSVWAKDRSFNCECPACRKAGFLKSFAECINQTARECRKYFPGLTVDFLAYNAALAWNMLAPVDGVDLSACSTQMAYWGRDYRDRLGAARSPNDRKAQSYLRKWRRLSRHSLYVLEYYTDLWMLTHLIAPLPQLIAADCREYAARGVDDLGTLIVLCPNALKEKAASMGAFAPGVYPNLYFFATFAWDPAAKPRQVLADYCRARYGRDADVCMGYLLKLEKTLARITAFNQKMFRLRFVDTWTRDATPEEGGIKFLPLDWAPRHGWTRAERERFRACRQMGAALRRFEEKAGWPLVETCTAHGRRSREFRQAWAHVRRRIEGIDLQLSAQKAMMDGQWTEAGTLLSRALQLGDGVSKTDRRACRRWLKSAAGGSLRD